MVLVSFPHFHCYIAILSDVLDEGEGIYQDMGGARALPIALGTLLCLPLAILHWQPHETGDT